MHPKTVPSVVFHTRERNETLGGHNPFEWRDVTSAEVFDGKSVVLLGVPGAFTPACSNSHLPEFERDFEQFRALGVDAIYCTSVNDAFVMFQWAKSLDVSKVQMLPDGNGDFAKRMGLLVNNDKVGMGRRSWRYAAHIVDGEIKKIFAEPDMMDNPPGVPVVQSNSKTMLGYLSV